MQLPPRLKATARTTARQGRLAAVLPLDAAGRLYAMTDKHWHGYLTEYHRAFSPIRYRRKRVLEIGVGGGADPELGGGSLRLWRDYFPFSRVVGLDIHD